MVQERCLKENFVALEQIRPDAWIIRFSPIPEMIPVLDGEGNPTGEMVESGWLICTSATVNSLDPGVISKIRIEEVTKYDNSDAVNAFFYNGKKMWFDKLTRTALVYSMNVEKESGKEYTELYDNDCVKYVLPIDTALSLFSQIEFYAKECYNQTAFHKVKLSELETVEELLAYDIKSGYPEKLRF